MSIDVFTIQCDALDGAKLVGFKGVEGLGRPFEFDLFFTVPVGTDVRGAVGERATLTADRDDGRGPMCWQGILAGARLLHETAERALYRASLVPKLWVLQQYVRSYVHTKKKIDAYVADTLKDGGLTGGDFEFKSNAGAYPQEEFVCQYRESHLDFVHRWLEREGLYYYFEHGEGAGATEKMVVVDDKAHHGPLLGDGHVRYFAGAGADGSAGACLRELSADFRLLPASVHVSDYNYANPAAPVTGEKPVASGGQGKIREYGYRVFTEGEAKRLAQVKAQSIGCRELVLQASGTYLGLRAGYTFEVEEGPSDLPARYLAIEVKHAGAVSGAAPLVMRYTGLDPKETYRVDVVAIPADVQYRAPQSTAWPRIYGFENGTVDGPGESQYAQIDDQGRYLVRFKFDTSDLPDGSTSTYLRMMQPHGGTTEGWHFPLRKGTEVMVSFQGGDPDRPVIAGVVPNAVTPSNVTNRNHTQNVVRSGGGNYMVMDDTEGVEYIDMGTPGGNTYFYMGDPRPEPSPIGPPDPNWPPRTAKIPGTKPGEDETPSFSFSYYVDTENSAGFNVGGNWWQSVGGGLSTDVANDARIRYGAAHTFIVGGATSEFYCGGLTQLVINDGTRQVFANWSDHVSARNYGHYGEWEVEVDGTWRTVVGGNLTMRSTGGDISISASAGEITLYSPTKINLISPEVQTKASGCYKGHSGLSLETYSSKFIIGGHKSDYVAALYTCGYGLKVETTGYSAGLFGVKGESGSAERRSFGGVFAQLGTHIMSRVLSMGTAGISSETAGLHELK